MARPGRTRRRARFWIAIAFAVFVFLGISALLGRALSGAGNERAQVLQLLQAQARGNGRAMLADLPACRAEPACAAQVRALAGRLRRPGHVEILAYDPTAEVTFTRRTGVGRVAWRAGTGLPVVQCVRARREGPLTGAGAELLSISAPIPRTSSCP
jgi:hypothetical protein